MQWSLIDRVALSLHSNKNAECIRLTRNHPTFRDAVDATDLYHQTLLDDAQSVLSDCDRLGVHVVGWGDDRYPARLKRLDNPPFMLYVWGELPDENRHVVAVVGTRSCTTQYGKPATDQLVSRWTEAGVIIVSGLANGIDTLAHEACLRARGTTVAVIASGISRIKPLNAERLARKIVDSGGAVIAERANHVVAQPPFFPSRNRIIAGISDALVVIESKESGGALITTDFAEKFGRPIWAVPGPITSTRSVGTNALIRDSRARILTEADDLLYSLGLFGMSALRSPLPPDLEMLGPDSHGIDDIAKAWECSVPEALTRMAEHEFAGLVKQLPGGQFAVDV